MGILANLLLFLNISFSTNICRARLTVLREKMLATTGTRNLMGCWAASIPASATILVME